MVRLTIAELQSAELWARNHSNITHSGEMVGAVIAIRNLPGGGIGTRTVVMCEKCDGQPGNSGNPANYLDVTDYESW